MNNKRKITVTNAMNKVADLVELAIAVALTAGVLILFVQLGYRYGLLAISQGTFAFNEFLSEALNIIIAIEFIRMLCRHTPDTIVEVLMFTAARQLIVLHPVGSELLFGVLSIAVLFIVRKHLLSEQKDSPTE